MNRYIFLLFIFSLLVNQFSCQNSTCELTVPTVVSDCTVKSVAPNTCCMVQMTISGNVTKNCGPIPSNITSNVTAMNAFYNGIQAVKALSGVNVTASLNCISSFQITSFFTLIILLISF